MSGLTRKQRRLLEFVIRYQGESGGVSPSCEDICAELGVHSKSTPTAMLNRLEERGYIRRLRGRARAIEVLRAPPPMPSKRPARLAVIYTEADLDHRSALKRVSYAAEQTEAA